MKKVIFSALLLVAAGSMEASTYGFVNFKSVIDGSKLGKQEQASFDALKAQMEKVLEEKDKELQGLVQKFNDPDYFDTLSPEAETELKNKAGRLQMEMNEKQNQFYQALQNAQVKIMSKIAEVVGAASKKIAADKKLDAVLNQDAAFYASDTQDVTKDIIQEMNAIFEKEVKEKTEVKTP